MSDERYAWQSRTFTLWANNNYHGILKAVTGSGKSYAALDCIRKYRVIYPDSIIWVVCDYNELKQQWTDLLASSGLSDVPVYLYGRAGQLLSNAEHLPDFLVLDEVHHLEAEQWGKVADFGVKHLLGLSATPNTECKKIGKIIQRIGFDQAFIAPSTSHLVVFGMNEEERAAYLAKCNALASYSEKHPHSTYRNDFVYMQLVNRRKAVVDSFPKRWEIGLAIVKRNFGRRMMLFFSKQAEVRAFAALLDAEGIPYAIQMSSCKQIEQFKSGKKDLLLSINMVATGFSDPTVEVGVMFTYPYSPRDAIQKVGRILRPNGDKHADIYYLIADGTMEESISKRKNQLFPPNTVKMETDRDYHEA